MYKCARIIKLLYLALSFTRDPIASATPKKAEGHPIKLRHIVAQATNKLSI